MAGGMADEVVALEEADGRNLVRCADGTEYPADVVVLGVGIRVNTDCCQSKQYSRTEVVVNTSHGGCFIKNNST